MYVCVLMMTPVAAAASGQTTRCEMVPRVCVRVCTKEKATAQWGENYLTLFADTR